MRWAPSRVCKTGLDMKENLGKNPPFIDDCCIKPAPLGVPVAMLTVLPEGISNKVVSWQGGKVACLPPSNYS